jgi:hypothetical protein
MYLGYINVYKSANTNYMQNDSSFKKKSKPDVVGYNTNTTTRTTALSNFKPPKYRHDHDRHRCK